MPTGKKPASEAGKELANKKTPAKAKEVAGSALSQANKNRNEHTGTKAASDAGKQLASGKTPAGQKTVAGSDLAQTKKTPKKK